MQEIAFGRAYEIMLIAGGKVIREASETGVLSSQSREIYWRGFPYKPGLRAGAESLRTLLDAPEEDIPCIAAKLKGIYFIAVQCKTSGNAYAFVDQAGLFHAFRSARLICTSFLELARLEKCRAEDVDPEAVVEFFHFGCVYEDRTYFPTIKKINADVVLRCNSAGRIDSLAKRVLDIAELPRHSFEWLLQDFAAAAATDRVSVDITGGADSRLLAAALAYFGLPFEMACSGRPGIPDLYIGAQVAEALGRPFHPTFHDVANCDWDELFSLSDAMFDVSKSGRVTQLQHERKKRGITLSVSGAAGEGLRETWWMHDFPFYRRREPRLARLYALRMAPQPLLHGLLRGRFRQCSERQRENLLRRAARYAVPGNTRTYDRIYYYLQLRTWCGIFVTSSIKLLNVGVPYSDPEVMRIGYNLPRMQRVFNRFHRTMISRYSPAVAALPTTESGVTLASGTFALSRDLSRYLADRSKRLAKKIGQQVLGKTFFQDTADDPRMFDELLNTMTMLKSTQVLADCGVFGHAVDPRSIPQRYLGTVFVLGRLFEEIGRSSSTGAAGRRFPAIPA
jgi:hypothetical protein